MFPSFGNPCWGGSHYSGSRQDYQQRKLKFLKWMRDDLETRLAGFKCRYRHYRKAN